MSFRKAAVLALTIFLAAGSAAAKTPTLWELTPEHFRDTADLKDGPLDATAIITTQPGYVEKHGLLRIVWNDNFLRAFIDKKSHKVTYQIYQIIYYGGGWRFYSTVNYQTPTGLKSAEATRISQDVVDCSGGCSYVEHVAFEVDEGLLRVLAASYVPGKPGAFQFKFIGKTTADYTDGIAFSEIAGFLQRVDAYVQSLPTSQTHPDVAADQGSSAGGVRPMLGGRFVDLPPGAGKAMGVEAGVIVIVVSPNSVADKAGLHVGDVVTSYADKPITTVKELQAAVAGSNVGEPTVIKLRRGTSDLTVTAQRGGPTFSDTGISGLAAGRNRREVHAETET